MATVTRRLKDPLSYLEQVRQHLGRLPGIDPNTRTLLICGYPNVGKSSFLRNITRADVDVQPYAFTTKSLFVGHFDYKYLRFQAIDTPGILDHPLEEMNTIEMQSITAIAHLKSVILYFMDLSEQCGYTVAAQVQLYHSIKPLFANKLVFVVINKIDVARPEDLDAANQALLQSMLKTGEVELLQLSCQTEEGVMEVRNTACERLLAARVDQKLKSSRVNDVLNRIHVARPIGGVEREAFIPDIVKQKKKYDANDPERIRLERDIEAEEGGAGVYNINLKKNYLLENDDWKNDKIPEIYDGKNVYDFIDPDIEAKLADLEAEEERLEAEGFYDEEESIEDDEEAEIRAKAEFIREQKQLIRNTARSKKSLKNRAIIPRKSMPQPLSTMEESLSKIGLDPSRIASRARSRSRGRSLAPPVTSEAGGDGEDTQMRDISRMSVKERAKSRARSQSNRREDGVPDVQARSQAEKIAKLNQRKMNRMAKAGESDRHVAATMPKHLVSSFPILSYCFFLLQDCLYACHAPYYCYYTDELTYPFLNYSLLEREPLERLNVVRTLCVLSFCISHDILSTVCDMFTDNQKSISFCWLFLFTLTCRLRSQCFSVCLLLHTCIARRSYGLFLCSLNDVYTSEAQYKCIFSTRYFYIFFSP